MRVTLNASLAPYNTFGIDVPAQRLVTLQQPSDLTEALAIDQPSNFLVVGGGSNILFTQPFEGTILHVAFRGIELISEDEESVRVRVAAGENWHQFVTYCVQKNWQGVENLSLIPGTVGAAPVQNIGAYGVEVCEVLECVEAVELATKQPKVFSVKECGFGYRKSVFKYTLKGQYLITHVVFRLRKKPQYNTSYGALASMLAEQPLTVHAISQAVIAIRQSKLPDPNELGNCGSFFKNPVISEEQFNQLKQKYPAIVGFPQGEGVKVAAGWLIDHAGWKGKRLGNVGTYPKQALVMVNWGGATGGEAKAFAEQVQQVVQQTFGVWLEPEVNIL